MTPAIETRGLTKRFGEVTALDSLDLVVPGRGVFGFLGANGAGKTTTLNLLTGLSRASSGTMRLLGRGLEDDGGAVRRELGYLPQTPAFPAWMTGEEYLLHVADLFGLSRSEGRKRARELLERSGLEEKARRRRIGGYSGGMKQRLGIAQALVSRPKLVMLDEPVSALDPVGRVEVLELIEDIGRESTVFMSSHILADVERVCREVAILDKGRLLVHSRTDELRARALQPIFELSVRGTIEPLLMRLRNTDCITDLSVTSQEEHLTTLRVTVRDVEEGERVLPRLVADSGIGLVSLKAAMPTLEEVFLRLVGRRAGEVQA